MEKMIKVSIITVTYNCKNTIENTVKSVIEQNYDGIEYIIIDGASNDGTKEILDTYADYFAYYVSEKDSGIYDAMNKGIKHATGDLIYFINGDDYLIHENVISEVAEQWEDDETIIVGREFCSGRLTGLLDLEHCVSPYIDVFYPHQATFVPRNIYLRLGMFDQDYKIASDYDWICRALFEGVKCKSVDCQIAYYTIGGRSAFLGCIEDQIKISRKYLLLSEQTDLLGYMEEWYREKARDVLLRVTISNEEYDEKIRKILETIFDLNKPVQIWGLGYLSEFYLKLFERMNIKVSCAIDNKKAGIIGNGIPVRKYDVNHIGQLFITTEFYDDEISEMLKRDGFVDGTDFISHYFFKKKLLTIISDDVFESFYLSTGVSIK